MSHLRHSGPVATDSQRHRLPVNAWYDPARLDPILACATRSELLAERIGTTEFNVSLLKSGRIDGVRFETPAKIGEVLECQPTDTLEYTRDDP